MIISGIVFSIKDSIKETRKYLLKFKIFTLENHPYYLTFSREGE